MIAAIKKFLNYLALFYRYTRWRLPVLFLLIAAGGVTEAVGIVSLLPLLDVAIGETSDSPITRAVADTLNTLGITPSLGNLLLVIVAVFLVRSVFVYLYTYFTAHIMVTVRRNLQIGHTKMFSEMSFPYFAERTTGWFNNIMVGEIARFVSSLRAFTRLSVNAINFLVFLPFALTLKPEITLVVFALGGIVLWSLKGFIRKTAQLSRLQTINAGLLNAEFIQFLQAFIYLKATNTMAAVNRHVVDTIGRLADNELQIRRIAAIFASISEPIAVVVLAAFIFYEVGIAEGSFAEIVVFALLLYRMLIKLVSLAPQLQAFNQTIGGVFAIRDVARELAQHIEPSGTGQTASPGEAITFHNVAFRHGNTDILKDLNIIVRPNETIGIVGESGAGKTTFFHLLTGLLKPCGGHISIGDTAYSEIDLGSFRDRIGYVTQEPIIFNDSVANNISLWQYDGRDEKCLERIRAAARTARCDGFVETMERGYDTLLGDRGINLSGGERQRIAIAREVYKNPSMLIFDEAASALDAGSERYVQESIDRMQGERTVIVITHRLASVRRCDRIYVFRSGRVVDEGSFDELHGAKDSYFRQMCDQQGLSR